MHRAIGETERRRDRQLAHNALHGIVPVGVVKDVTDILEGAYAAPGRGRARGRTAAEPQADYRHAEDMRPAEVAREIGRLEEQMYQYARNLEFEEAARVRDRLAALKERLFVSA